MEILLAGGKWVLALLKLALDLCSRECKIRHTLKGEVEGEEKAWRRLPWSAVFVQHPVDPVRTVGSRPMRRTMSSAIPHREKRAFMFVSPLMTRGYGWFSFVSCV